MSDRYQAFSRGGLGRLLVRHLRLPDPVPLQRWRPGAPLVEGTVLLGGTGRLDQALPAALDRLGIVATRADDRAERFRALVLDATGIEATEGLGLLREFLGPRMRRLHDCSRVVVLGTPPAQVAGQERVAQRALEGFTRSLGKEIGHGGTVQLVYVAPGAEQSLDSTLAFLLSPKSAYVSGQAIRVGAPTTPPGGRGEPGDGSGRGAAAEPADPARPLAGRLAVVTGASRGIGAEIARVLARDGATVLGVDVAQAASELVTLAAELGGDHLVLDVTRSDAPQRLAHHVSTAHGGADVVVHNAGITRDRRLANMTAERWDSVLAVNLTAPVRLTRTLLDRGAINPDGRIVGVASVAGIAGNLGQTNYATSKAGMIGMVEALAPELGELGSGITANAVAPGFIETQMTAAVPFATREVGRRLNAMAQGGLPVDVAETVAWLAHPGSSAVSGNVVRVCGQMLLGA